MLGGEGVLANSACTYLGSRSEWNRDQHDIPPLHFTHQHELILKKKDYLRTI